MTGNRSAVLPANVLIITQVEVDLDLNRKSVQKLHLTPNYGEYWMQGSIFTSARAVSNLAHTPSNSCGSVFNKGTSQ